MLNRKPSRCVVLVAFITIFVVIDSAAANDPVAYVTLVQPPLPGGALLESGMRINISHVNVNWKTRWNEGGTYRIIRWRYHYLSGYRFYLTGISNVTAGFDQKSAELWVNKARADLAASLQEASRSAGIDLKLVDRRHVADRLDERDLETADIVESDPIRPRVKSLGIDGKIYADIDIDVHLQTGSDTTVSGIYSWYRPCGWRWYSRVDYSRRRSIRRIITFQANFTLEDAKTGRVWQTHAASWQPIDTRRPSAFFGSDQSRIDFDQPDESLIMAFVNREVPNFISMLVPMERNHVVRVTASGDSDCKRGVRLLAQRNYEAAYRALSEAINDDDDDARAHFAAAVACIAVNEHRLARSHYRAAIRFADDDDLSHYRMALGYLDTYLPPVNGSQLP